MDTWSQPENKGWCLGLRRRLLRLLLMQVLPCRLVLRMRVGPLPHVLLRSKGPLQPRLMLQWLLLLLQSRR